MKNLVFLICLLGLAGCGETERNDTSLNNTVEIDQSKESIKRAISQLLKDSDATFDFINDTCGTVNSINSFEGHLGPRRFVYVNKLVILQGYNVNQSEMDVLWKKYCA